jgi:branched-chain amino acid transport system ATP-binding protein
MVGEISSVLKGLNEEGLSIILVEQNVSIALSIAHFSYLLSIGSIVVEGNFEILINVSRVKEFYLGEVGIDLTSPSQPS